MYELGFYVPFNSISVISGRWKGEHERLCAIKDCFLNSIILVYIFIHNLILYFLIIFFLFFVISLNLFRECELLKMGVC